MASVHVHAAMATSVLGAHGHQAQSQYKAFPQPLEMSSRCKAVAAGQAVGHLVHHGRVSCSRCRASLKLSCRSSPSGVGPHCPAPPREAARQCWLHWAHS